MLSQTRLFRQGMANRCLGPMELRAESGSEVENYLQCKDWIRTQTGYGTCVVCCEVNYCAQRPYWLESLAPTTRP
jgi:hypothetical protein